MGTRLLESESGIGDDTGKAFNESAATEDEDIALPVSTS